jgi:hypothetical protein
MTWAVVDHIGRAIPVSNSGHGAKCYATRKGYKVVCRVSPYSMGCYNLLEKKGKRWHPVQ